MNNVSENIENNALTSGQDIIKNTVELISPRDKLSLKSIIGYGFGEVANNIAFAMGAMFLLGYYTEVVGFSAAAAGTMLLIIRCIDAFADIAAGRLVDSVNTRWGKFRPFLIFGSIPLMCFSILVFFVPESFSYQGKLIFAYITYLGFGISYSLVNIPYGSLATVLTQDTQSRAKLGVARGIGSSLTFVAIAILIGPKISKSNAIDSASIYHLYTICLAFVGYLSYVICFKSTKENVVRVIEQPSFKLSIQTIKSNKPLLMLCFSALSTLISSFSVSASTLYYVRYIVHDPKIFSIIIMVQMLVGILCSAPLVPQLVKKYGKKYTFLIGNMIALVGYLLFFFANTHSISIALMALAVASIGLGVSMTVMWALEADTVEYGEYISGVRIEGLTYSFFSFTRKCGQALGGSIPAFILGYCGYVANQEQPDSVIMGIRISIALIPALFMLISLVIMWFYPLTDKKYKEIVEIIHQRNNQQK